MDAYNVKRELIERFGNFEDGLNLIVDSIVKNNIDINRVNMYYVIKFLADETILDSELPDYILDDVE